MQETKARQSTVKSPDYHFLIIAFLFLLSGMSSLIYQVIWTRMLVFVFGSTTFATSTVLAVFMGGLALGSFIAGQVADRTKKPLFIYGALEGIIGIWAAVTPLLFAAAIPLYKMFFEPLHSDLILFGLLRFAVASAILLVPTACMGATLPILARFVTERLEEVGNKIGSLYAVNTLGAVLGSAIGGFILLPELGLNLTTMIASSTNILLAASVFFISRLPAFKYKQKLDESEQENKIQENETVGKSQAKLSNVVIATMFAFAISGAFAMIYEVAWTRSLLMVIGSTTYAFTIMLSSFLFGIFFGSILCARLADHLKSPIMWFALAQITLCLAGFLALRMFSYLPYLNLQVSSINLASSNLSTFFRFMAAMIVLLPISLCLGVIFPLAVKVCTNDLNRIGSSVGKLYSVNTIGAIIGAFLAGFAIIPNLGSEQTLIICSASNLLIGTALLIFFCKIRASIKVLSCIAALSVFAWAIQGPHFWDYDSIVSAQLARRRMSQYAGQLGSEQSWIVGGKNIFYKEGKTANVAVRHFEHNDCTSLLTNGHVDASNYLDMENQAMLAACPLLAMPSAENICVIGWGSGVTTGFALRFPIKEMICSEIEPVVIETSPFFHSVNFKPEKDKRTKIEPSDGRNFLLGTSAKFDIIISEPSNPWQAGVCNLFTREYFQICHDSLKENGIFTMWTQTNEIPSKNFAQVFAALSDVFPAVYVLDSGVGDVNALGFKKNTKLKFDDIKKQLQIKEVRDALSRFKLRGPDDYIARIIVAPDGLRNAVKGQEANIDDSNHLEYDVAKTYENKFFTVQNHEWLTKNSSRIWDSIDWGKMSDSEKSANFLQIARACLPRSKKRTFEWASESMRINPNPDSLSFIAELHITNRDYKVAGKLLEDGQKLYPQDSRFPGLAGLISLRKGDYDRARDYFSRALKLDSKNNNDFAYFLALTYSDLNLQQQDGSYLPPATPSAAAVIQTLQPVLANDKFVESKPAALLVLAEAYKQIGKYDEAEKTLIRLLKKSDKGFMVWQKLAETYACKKDWERSAYCWNKSFIVASRDLPRFLARTKDLINDKNYDEALKQLQLIKQMLPSNKEADSLLDELAKHYSKAAEYSKSLKKCRSLGI